MVVVIDLQKDDDPQVIFESLNARGEPLLPADLLRNYIFFRATREKLDVEALYKKYWSRFDDEFWREEVKQGRLNRPRSDLFMQHFLSSHQGEDIPIKHLYVEYRHWIESTKPFSSVTVEIETLARQGDDFRRIIAPEKDDVIFELCSFLEAYDIRTAYPLLLAIMDAEPDDAEWKKISRILESYLIRRRELKARFAMPVDCHRLRQEKTLSIYQRNIDRLQSCVDADLVCARTLQTSRPALCSFHQRPCIGRLDEEGHRHAR